MLCAGFVTSLPGRPLQAVDGSEPQPEQLGLAELNRMYREGRPSNNLAAAGLFVHQHDSSEQWTPLFDAMAAQEWPHWAGSVVSRSMSGLYNEECGIIVRPEAAKVLCSYYADFTSWNVGCDTEDILDRWTGHEMSRKPSRPRNKPYDGPGELKEMLEMSLELQNGSTALARGAWGTRSERRDSRERLRTRGDGEPAAWDFWEGYYNEVLINRSYYAARLPGAVAGVFYLSGASAGEGRACADSTLSALRTRYGDDAVAHVKVFAHTPGQGFASDADQSAIAQDGEQGGQEWQEKQPEAEQAEEECSETCVDVPPPSHWDVPTCEGQLSKGRCEKRIQLADGWCEATCGICVPCVSQADAAEKAAEKKAAAEKVAAERAAEKEALQPVQVVAPERKCINEAGEPAWCNGAPQGTQVIDAAYPYPNRPKPNPNPDANPNPNPNPNPN